VRHIEGRILTLRCPNPTCGRAVVATSSASGRIQHNNSRSVKQLANSRGIRWGLILAIVLTCHSDRIPSNLGGKGDATVGEKAPLLHHRQHYVTREHTYIHIYIYMARGLVFVLTCRLDQIPNNLLALYGMGKQIYASLMGPRDPRTPGPNHTQGRELDTKCDCLLLTPKDEL
jgi:hypothetical protein